MLQVVGGLLLTAAIIGALAAVGKAALYVFGVFRKLNTWLDDWAGEPPRPGFPNGRPGVLDRLASIETNATSTADTLSTTAGTLVGVEARLAALEAQMYPNGGHTLRDAIDRAAAHNDRPHPPDVGAEQPAIVHS
jgi:hypothetical protein